MPILGGQYIQDGKSIFIERRNMPLAILEAAAIYSRPQNPEKLKRGTCVRLCQKGNTSFKWAKESEFKSLEFAS